MNLYAFHWTAGGWIPVGGVLNAEVVSAGYKYRMYPTIALDAGGAPVVAWNQGNQNYVTRWTGSAWQPLGTRDPAPQGQAFEQPVLAADAQGRLVVAERFGFDHKVVARVRRWDGTTWIPLGGNLDAYAGTTLESTPTGLAFNPEGNPIVVFGEQTAPLPLTAAMPINLFVWQYGKP